MNTLMSDALHDTPPQQWPSAFRGLRQGPLTDPFAYLAGQRERRRLRASVAAPSPWWPRMASCFRGAV